MKLKKFLASILAVCMVMSTMGTVAFADEPVSGAIYDELDDNGEEIKLTNDIDVEANNTTNGAITSDVILMGATVSPDVSNIIEIWNWEDLKDLDAIVEGGNMLEGVTVKLMNDIDLYEMGTNGEPVTFNPIGANQAYFKGTFDGQGYTIKNMYQSGWALGFDWYNYGTIGLFAYLWDATVKNLTIENAECLVEGGNVAAIAGCAWGDCTFENIKVKNSTFATYNNRAAGIVGYTGGEGTMTFKDIVVDEKTVIAGLWGSFDSSLGGLIGSIQDPTKIVVENAAIKCRLDAYNDCTASYKYYAYRMCGMLIGKMPVDSNNKPVLDNLTITDVDVEFDNWANYTYIWDDSLSRGCQRIEPGYQYGGVDVTQYPGAEITSQNFNSLFGGQQYGSYGQSEHEDVEVTYAYAAKIGDNGYWTLDDAISNANENDTITLLKDVTENVTINKDITIDGADKNYTGKMTISKSINLTIDDVNFINGNIVKGKSTDTSGTYIIKNCSFNSDSDSVYAIEIRGSGSIIIENCTSEGYFGFLQIPSTNNSVSIKDVTIDGTSYAIKVDYSNGVSLENVTITNSTYGFVNSNFGTKTIAVKNCTIKTDYPLVIWDRDTKKVNTFKFDGNNDFGANAFYYNKVTEDEMAYTKYVLGGNATLTAVAGLNVTANNGNYNYNVIYENGTYKVVKVAKIGEKNYYNLQEAIDAAKDGEEVQLLKDVTESVTVKAPVAANSMRSTASGIAINLNDFTLTGDITVNSDATATIKNGAIVNTSNEKHAIDSEGNITIENVDITSSMHAVRVRSGEATINGGNYITTGTVGSTTYAVLASGKSQVTINNGVFTGPANTVADSGSAVGAEGEGTKIVINNGKFSGGYDYTLLEIDNGEIEVVGGMFDQDPAAYIAPNSEAIDTAS